MTALLTLTGTHGHAAMLEPVEGNLVEWNCFNTEAKIPLHLALVDRWSLYGLYIHANLVDGLLYLPVPHFTGAKEATKILVRHYLNGEIPLPAFEPQRAQWRMAARSACLRLLGWPTSFDTPAGHPAERKEDDL